MPTRQLMMRSATWFAILVMFACGDKATVPAVAPSPTASQATVGTNVLSVTVSPPAVTMNAGDKVTLAASVDAEAGVTDRTVTWSSSNTAIATVDQNGVVTAVGQGTVSITAASKANGNVRGAAAITVIGPAPGTATTSTSTTYSTSLTVSSDPAGHEAFTRYTSVRDIRTDVSGSTVTITGGSPWVTITGTINSSNVIAATGTGTVAGFSNVTVTFNGNLFGSGGISGTVVLGPGLPQNQNETLSLTGTKQ